MKLFRLQKKNSSPSLLMLAKIKTICTFYRKTWQYMGHNFTRVENVLSYLVHWCTVRGARLRADSIWGGSTVITIIIGVAYGRLLITYCSVVVVESSIKLVRLAHSILVQPDDSDYLISHFSLTIQKIISTKDRMRKKGLLLGGKKSVSVVLGPSE